MRVLLNGSGNITESAKAHLDSSLQFIGIAWHYRHACQTAPVAGHDQGEAALFVIGQIADSRVRIRRVKDKQASELFALDDRVSLGFVAYLDRDNAVIKLSRRCELFANIRRVT